MQVLTIAGTRPELIKLVPVMQALHRYDKITSLLCHSGQHADLGREVLTVAAILPDDLLNRPKGSELSDLLAGLTLTVGAAIDRMRPDAVVVQGDTATTLAGAMAAFHRQIPVAHVEAGLRSGDLARPFPEEGYRRLVSQLAHWHFAPTPTAAQALRDEGIAQSRISTVGNTVIDALHWAMAKLNAKPDLGAAAMPLIAGAGGRPIVLATVHRRENDAHILKSIADGLRALVETEDVALVLPLHPRAQSAILRERLAGVPRVALTQPLDYFAFVRMMRAARLIISDSGGVQEEATALGRATLILRKVTERGEAIASGTARLVGHDADALVAAARNALARPGPEPSEVFGDGRAGERIAAILSEGLA